MANDREPASRKRLVLSWYIDFLFFSVAAGLAVRAFGGGGDGLGWIEYLVFLALRALVDRLPVSLGRGFLSINTRDRTVPRVILENESWLTLLLGVLVVLEGTKQLVRWTTLLVPRPYFGVLPDTSGQLILHVATGIVFVGLGFAILKLDLKGLYGGLAASALTALSTVLSWDLLRESVGKMAAARRSLQGRTVRPGEVDFMKDFVPTATLLAACAMAIALLIASGRFERARKARGER